MGPLAILAAIEAAAKAGQVIDNLIGSLRGDALAAPPAEPGGPTLTAEDVAAAIARGKAAAGSAKATGTAILDRLDREGK